MKLNDVLVFAFATFLMLIVILAIVWGGHA